MAATKTGDGTLTGIVPARLWQLRQRILNWPYLAITLLVVVTLVFHLLAIGNTPALIFDEQHYIPDARAIIEGRGTLRPEHPPLAKLFFVAGIRLFGDNPFGWRIFPGLFGTASLALFYFICRKVTSERATLLATFLYALETLTFTQTSVAMLDAASLTFALAALLLYLHHRYPLSGLAVALSVLAKLYGGLIIIAIGLHWLFTRRDKPVLFLTSMAMSGVFFLGLMPVFDYLTNHQWLNPISQVQNMMRLSGSLTFATTQHDALSRPWEWVLIPRLMPYWYTPHYIAVISFTVWALIIPAVVYMTYQAIRRDSAGILGLAWFFATYIIWIPASIITDRISFLFYFYPTIGAICLGIGLTFDELMKRVEDKPARIQLTAGVFVFVFLLMHAAVFLALSPVFPRLFKIYG